MFKKISHIILSLLLLFATVGMAVSTHYCAGELVDVSVYGSSDNCCSGGDCCQNEVHIFQVKDSFAQPAVSFVPASSIITLLANDFIPVDGFSSDQPVGTFHFNTEPPPVLPLKTAIAVRQVFLL